MCKCISSTFDCQPWAWFHVYSVLQLVNVVLVYCRRAFVTADTWWAWFRVNSVFLLVSVVLLLAGLTVVPLTFAHVYVALVNLTTWELMSGDRITYLRHLNDDVSPFHRGYLRNFVTFCCICRPQNWARRYRKLTEHGEQLPDGTA